MFSGPGVEWATIALMIHVNGVCLHLKSLPVKFLTVDEVTFVMTMAAGIQHCAYPSICLYF